MCHRTVKKPEANERTIDSPNAQSRKTEGCAVTQTLSLGHRTRHLAAVVGLVFAQVTFPAAALDSWPQFRGLTGGVVADDPSLPDTWSQTENVAWKIALPGQGWGSPIVWNDFVFVTAAIGEGPDTQLTSIVPGTFAANSEHGSRSGIPGGTSKDFTMKYRWVLYAFDFKTGAKRWETELRSGVPLIKKYVSNTYASETPATDGERVYVYHGAAGLFAVDFKGKVVWSRSIVLPDVSDQPATSASATLKQGQSLDVLPPDFLADLGSAASPVVHNGRIYLTIDHEPRQWMLMAIDARTGKDIWTAHHVKTEQAYGWSTPYVWQNDRRTEIVVAGDLAVRAFDLDGTQLWEFKKLSVNSTPTPFAANGLLYVASGYPADRNRPLVAIRPGASGDISLKDGETSNAYVVWHQRTGAAYMNSSLVYGDFHYTLLTQGYLTCYDARTGRLVYGRQRIDVDTTGFTASPWAYNGKLFALSEDGNTYVIQPGPEFKVLRKNTLDEPVLATPAIVRGSVFIRTASHLYRIAKP
jgi:outer membrane protein assembly factor BamB